MYPCCMYIMCSPITKFIVLNAKPTALPGLIAGALAKFFG